MFCEDSKNGLICEPCGSGFSQAYSLVVFSGSAFFFLMSQAFSLFSKTKDKSGSDHIITNTGMRGISSLKGCNIPKKQARPVFQGNTTRTFSACRAETKYDYLKYST